jgi:ABC-type branched-subunit amino acid transport system ATPase component
VSLAFFGPRPGSLRQAEANDQHRAGSDRPSALFAARRELSFGLTPANVAHLGEVIKSIAARGVGILLIEQFTRLRCRYASRAYVMERGHLAFEGTSAELEAKPEVLHGAYLATSTNKAMLAI